MQQLGHPSLPGLGCLVQCLGGQPHGRKTLQDEAAQVTKIHEGQAKLTHCNPVFVPFHRKHSATLRVKIGTVRCSAPLSDTTASIIVDCPIARGVVLSVDLL